MCVFVSLKKKKRVTVPHRLRECIMYSITYTHPFLKVTMAFKLSYSVSFMLEHLHWWSHKFSNMTPQKTNLSILPSHFIIHITSMNLYL